MKLQNLETAWKRELSEGWAGTGGNFRKFSRLMRPCRETEWTLTELWIRDIPDTVATDLYISLFLSTFIFSFANFFSPDNQEKSTYIPIPN